MSGAAKITTGNIATHAIIQDTSQWVIDGKLAIPDAISDVIPDWMVPKTKWLYRRGMLSMGAVT
jgi:hypothetical protein